MLDSRVTAEHLGLIPKMLSEDDPRPAREQLDTGYRHGGGWRPFEGFDMAHYKDMWWLLYPNDPPTRSLAYCKLRDEIIVVYQHAWVAIIQPDGSFEVCRMD
jgi:hypothetical protein